MRAWQYHVSCSLIVLTALAASTSAQAADGASGDVATTPEAPGDIIVTARRREERLADVPVAVTALDEDALKAAQVITPKQLSDFIPSLNVNTGNSRDGNRFTLRGQGATLAAGEAVVTYLAEAPVPYLGAGAPGMYFDLANVQVLNGPQGTLFGRNTTGGAVLFTPRRPQNDNSGFVEFGYGNYQNREMSGAINVALIPDKLLLRAAGTWRKRDGYTRNIADGERLDELNYYGLRASILARPTDWLENYLLLQISESNTSGTGFFLEQINPNFPTFLAARTAAFARQQTLGPREVDNNSDTFYLAKTAAIVNTTTASLSEEITLKNIFSYFGSRSKNGFDIDGSTVDIVTYFNFPQHANTSGNGLANERYINEELNLSGQSLGRKLSWVIGGFYQHYEPKGYSAQDYSLFGVRRILDSTETGSSRALYGQATLNLGVISPVLENLKLTAGYRYTWDRKRARSSQYNKSTLVCFSRPAGLSFPNCDVNYAGRFSHGTYTFGLDYKINRDLLIYVTTRHGYKSGGFNTSTDPTGSFKNFIAFGPETITDYEAGLKGSFLLGGVRLSTTLAAFTSDYKGIQRNQTVLVPPAIPGGPPTTTNLVLNAGAGKISGVELQQTARIGGLTFDGSFSYLDAHYTHYMLPGGIDRAGVALPYSPKYKFSGSAAYTMSMGDDVGEVTGRLSYSYSSRYRFGDPDQPGNYMGGWGLFNFDASINRIAGTPLNVDLYVTNVLNRRHVQQRTPYYDVFGLVSAFYTEPRMYGFRARYNF